MSEILNTRGAPVIWQQKNDNYFGIQDFDKGKLLAYETGDIYKDYMFGFLNIQYDGPDDWMLNNGDNWVHGWYAINPDMKAADWQLIVPSDFLQDCDPVD